MKQKPSKRIVSKWKYFEAQIHRVYMASYGFAICLVSAYFIVLALWGAVSIVLILGKGEFPDPQKEGWDCFGLAICVVIVAVCSVIAYLSGFHAKRTIKKFTEINPAELYIRADRLENDCLVRASEEPSQVQQTVLLRAAIESTEEHEEQLLRASQDKNKIYGNASLYHSYSCPYCRRCSHRPLMVEEKTRT